MAQNEIREWSHYLMDIYYQEGNDESVDYLLKLLGQRPQKDETTHSKTYRHHFQPSRKRYHRI